MNTKQLKIFIKKSAYMLIHYKQKEKKLTLI